MKTVKISADGQKVALRLELLVRLVWAVVSSVVLFFFGIIAMICALLQWLHILVTRRRHAWLNRVLASYVFYRAKLNAYLFMLTDERSPILPED